MWKTRTDLAVAFSCYPLALAQAPEYFEDLHPSVSPCPSECLDVERNKQWLAPLEVHQREADQPGQVCSSLWVVSLGSSEKGNMLIGLVLVLPSTWPQSWSTWQQRSWSWQGMLHVRTRRQGSCPGTFSWLWEMMMSWTRSLLVWPFHKAGFCQTSLLSSFQRKLCWRKLVEMFLLLKNMVVASETCFSWSGLCTYGLCDLVPLICMCLLLCQVFCLLILRHF